MSIIPLSTSARDKNPFPLLSNYINSDFLSFLSSSVFLTGNFEFTRCQSIYKPFFSWLSSYYIIYSSSFISTGAIYSVK